MPLSLQESVATDLETENKHVDQQEVSAIAYLHNQTPNAKINTLKEEQEPNLPAQASLLLDKVISELNVTIPTYQNASMMHLPFCPEC